MTTVRAGTVLPSSRHLTEVGQAGGFARKLHGRCTESARRADRAETDAWRGGSPLRGAIILRLSPSDSKTSPGEEAGSPSLAAGRQAGWPTGGPPSRPVCHGGDMYGRLDQGRHRQPEAPHGPHGAAGWPAVVRGGVHRPGGSGLRGLLTGMSGVGRLNPAEKLGFV